MMEYSGSPPNSRLCPTYLPVAPHVTWTWPPHLTAQILDAYRVGATQWAVVDAKLGLTLCLFVSPANAWSFSRWPEPCIET